MSDNKLHPKQAPSSDDSTNLDRKKIEEKLWHQAHLSFLAIRGFIIASIFVYILGIGSFVTGKVSEGKIITTSELISKILFVLVKLDRQNNDRFDRLSKQFKDGD